MAVMRAPDPNLGYEAYAVESEAFQKKKYKESLSRLTARKARGAEIARQASKVQRYSVGPQAILASGRQPLVQYGIGGAKIIRKAGSPSRPVIIPSAQPLPKTIIKATQTPSTKKPSFAFIGPSGAKTIIGRKRVPSAHGLTEKDIEAANIELTKLSERSIATLKDIDVREYKAALKAKPLPYGKTAEEYEYQLGEYVEKYQDALTRTPEHFAEAEIIISEEKKPSAEQLAADIGTREKLTGFKYYGGIGLAKGEFQWSGSGKLSEYATELNIPTQKEIDAAESEGNIPLPQEKILTASYLEGMYGGGGSWQPKGEYEVYDYSTGVITKKQAVPQSLRKIPNINYAGGTYSLEEFKGLTPTQKNEVVGQQFDYSKYKDNPNYTIDRGPRGKVTKIYSVGSGTGVPDYKAEEIFVRDGKVTKIINREDYTSEKQDGPNQRKVYDKEVYNYDEYGLLKNVSYADAKKIDKESRGVFQTKVKSYQDGMLSSQLFNTYSNGEFSSSRHTDYAAGTTTRTTAEGGSVVSDIGKTVFPTENLDVIRKTVPLSKVSMGESYAPAEMLPEQHGVEEKQIYNYKTKKYEKYNPNKAYGSSEWQSTYAGEFNRREMERLGFSPAFKTKVVTKGYRAPGYEPQRMINVGYTTPSGGILTYSAPAYAAPKILGTEEALFKSEPSKYDFLESQMFMPKESATKLAAAKKKLTADLEKKHLESLTHTQVVVWEPTTKQFAKMTIGGDIVGIKGSSEKGFTMFDKPISSDEYIKRAIGYSDYDKRRKARMFATSGFSPKDVPNLSESSEYYDKNRAGVVDYFSGYQPPAKTLTPKRADELTRQQSVDWSIIEKRKDKKDLYPWQSPDLYGQSKRYDKKDYWHEMGFIKVAPGETVSTQWDQKTKRFLKVTTSGMVLGAKKIGEKEFTMFKESPNIRLNVASDLRDWMYALHKPEQAPKSKSVSLKSSLIATPESLYGNKFSQMNTLNPRLSQSTKKSEIPISSGFTSGYNQQQLTPRKMKELSRQQTALNNQQSIDWALIEKRKKKKSEDRFGMGFNNNKKDKPTSSMSQDMFGMGFNNSKKNQKFSLSFL